MPREKGGHCWVLTLFESTGNTPQCLRPKGLQELALTESAHKLRAGCPAAEARAEGRTQHAQGRDLNRSGTSTLTQRHPSFARGGSASSQRTKHWAPRWVQPLPSLQATRGSSVKRWSKSTSTGDLAVLVYITAVVTIKFALFTQSCLGQERPSTRHMRHMELHQPKVIRRRTHARSLCCKPGLMP